ncbi:hypothetical protein OT109_12620 [Phycisphaeraceae bacterium D3-23]
MTRWILALMFAIGMIGFTGCEEKTAEETIEEGAEAVEEGAEELEEGAEEALEGAEEAIEEATE